MMYLIFTERKPNLAGIVSQYFDGFTLADAVGYWKGEEEKSCIITLITDDELTVKRVCKRINRENGQECCLMVSVPSTFEMV